MRKPKQPWHKAFWANRNKRSAVTLAGLFLCVAILLGVANNFIEPAILEAAQIADEDAMADLFPTALTFERINSPNVNFFGELAAIDFIYEAFNANGETLGYTVAVATDDIRMMVGIRNIDGQFWDSESELRISRVTILSMPPAVGTTTSSNVYDFVMQFGGLTGPVELIAIDTPSGNQVLAITVGCSVSESITYTINHAFSAVQTIVDDEMLSRAQAEQIIDDIITQTDIQLYYMIDDNGYYTNYPYYSQGGE